MNQRQRRTSLGALALLAAGSLLAGVGHASGPAPAADPTAQAPAAPGLGAVKNVLKDAVKDTLNAARNAGTGEAAAATPPANDPASRATALRRKSLREQDFVDNDDNNRDPFKSFLRLFVDKGTPKLRQVPAIFEKFALEELSLIAIVSGDAQPRAMFRDPSGLGQTIKRGDYISKAAARVTKILSDRVILEISETAPNGEARPIEKAVLLNPEGDAEK